jgi:hypothetical protein
VSCHLDVTTGTVQGSEIRSDFTRRSTFDQRTHSVTLPPNGEVTVEGMLRVSRLQVEDLTSRLRYYRGSPKGQSSRGPLGEDLARCHFVSIFDP